MSENKEEVKGGDFTERLDNLESKLDRLASLLIDKIEAEQKSTVKAAAPKKKRGRPTKNALPKETTPKKRGRPKKEASHQNNSSQKQVENEILIDEQTPGSDTSGKRILLSENDQVSKPTAMGRGTRQPRNNSANRTNRGNPSGRPQKNFGQISSVRLTGENKFFKMSEFKASKNDSKIDKLLWGNNERTPRPEPFDPIEVQCKVCNRYYSVNPTMVFHDPDDGLVYTCNNCSSGYRGGN